MARPIPKELLEQLELRYDCELYWVKSGTGRGPLGSRAGFLCTSGYRRLKFKGVRYPEHRVIWSLAYGGIPEDMFIDHIDGDKSNNELSNLRLATNQQNQFNRPASNISWCKQTSKWRVQFTIMDKSVASKRFVNLCKALVYRDYKRKELHMEFNYNREA